MAPQESKLRSIALTAVGAVLVAVGAGLLASAIIGGGDEKTSGVRAQNIPIGPTATSTTEPTRAIETVAGVRTAGAVSPTVATASPTTVVTVSAPAPTATNAPAVIPTNAPAATATPQATETPVVSTVTPVPATATPPGGLFASISGPLSVPPGGIATFIDSSPRAAEALNRTWTYPGGTRRVDLAVSVTFPVSPGCYPVSLSVVFPGGTRTTSIQVSVGGATC